MCSNGSQDICLTCYGNDLTTENPSCKSKHSYPLDSFRKVTSINNTYMPTLQDNFNCGIDTNGDFVVNGFDCQCAGPDATGFNGIPHYFSDEGGTDQWTGLKAAEIMLSELEDNSNANYDAVAYKAVVILTDGQPVGYTASNTKRKGSGVSSFQRAMVLSLGRLRKV